MAGVFRTIIEAVETRMTALGFVNSKDVFDFDHIPASVSNKSYRMDAKLRSNNYYSGDKANPVYDLEIWTIYSINKYGRDRNETWKTALDDREAIEKDIASATGIRSLAADPLVVMNVPATTTKMFEDYIISLTVFTINYERSLV